MTYSLCKRLIVNAINRQKCDEAFVSDMKDKLDVFLLNNRITDDQYNELISMLDQ